MARARNIKPGFWTNEHVVELTPWSRLLYIGLWAVADREGRLEDRPKRIKMEIFPADNVDVDELMQEIESIGLIKRYSVHGAKYVWIPGFSEHQNPHQNEKGSEIPPFQDDDIAPCTEHSSNGESNPAESLNLIPESLNLNPDTPTQTRKREPSAKPTDERFDTWYSSYPKKVGKPKAKQAFQKINWDKVDFDQVMASLEIHKQSDQWTKDNGKFIPHPTTYLNREGWNDELSTASQPSTSIASPLGYSHDPDEANRQMLRDLEEMKRQANGGGQIIPIRKEA